MQHVDKHVVKMIIEYAQLMSTAHRLLDGSMYIDITANGRSIKRWKLDDEVTERIIMKASHINHPSAIWTRSNYQNYVWLHKLWYYLCKEYTYRYSKVHSVETRMKDVLYTPPKNIIKSEFYPPTPAMPDIYKVNQDSITSYRKYYKIGKEHLANWKLREIPNWWSNQI